MRLNWFLAHPLKTSGRLRRAVRRLLRLPGASWAASPVRRVVQIGCFVLFLVLVFHVSWPYGPPEYAETFAAKQFIQAEAFLALDPLVSVSTALAGRAWVGSLAWAGVLLAACLIVPRGFCGYVCPLGTLIDTFDWAVGRRVTRFHLTRRGRWVDLKYFLLGATLLASVAGVLVSGFLAAIPIVTRGLVFLLGPVQQGTQSGWYLVPPIGIGHVLGVGVLLIVLGLGLLGNRFWCRYVCPTGAIFSVANHLRLTGRQVTADCIACGQCVKACPFDAIEPDFETRHAECTFCQTCGGVCPTRAITFTDRWHEVQPRPATEPAGPSLPVSRRDFFSGTAVAFGTILGTKYLFDGGRAAGPPGPILVRPPGSVPEPQFLQLCVRCGACFKVCPNDVLQPVAFQQGLEGLWTPRAVPDWSGCDPKCNNCGQACPTGAIRALPLEEKRSARMGLAVVDEKLCLPLNGRAECQTDGVPGSLLGKGLLCVDECLAAGYGAMEFIGMGGTATDEADWGGDMAAGDGAEPPGESYLAPVVLAEKCVGCGLCQTRCHKINVVGKRLIGETAIRVEAGPGKEDRLTTGSYTALRQAEQAERDRPSQSRPDVPYGFESP